MARFQPMVEVRCSCGRGLATLGRQWDGQVVVFPRRDLEWNIKPIVPVARAAGEPRARWVAVWGGEGGAGLPAHMTVTCAGKRCKRHHTLSPDTAAWLFREAVAARQTETTLPD